MPCENCEKLKDLLRRCLPIVEQDAAMASTLTRFAPLPPEAQAAHDNTEWESEKLLSLMTTALAPPSAPASEPKVATDPPWQERDSNWYCQECGEHWTGKRFGHKCKPSAPAAEKAPRDG